jgi:hypothetical protein
MNVLSLVMNSRTAWNDYFYGYTPSNYNSQLYTSRITRSDAYLCISNCLFRSISSSGYGGALYCTSATFMLIESTSFFSCKISGSSSHGGAIYFSNSGSQCVLYEVCGYDCSTTTYFDYQFACIYVNNSASIKNYFNYSSISRCVNEVSDTFVTLYLCYGQILCPSVNMSMNKNDRYSGIRCNPFVDSNSVTCSFTYSTFADNHAITYTCIYLTSTSANKEIKYCNIIRNTQGTLDSYGTIYTSGNLTIEDCCILENRATNIFCQGSSSYIITLSKCTVDSTSNNRNLTIQNTVSKSFILALNHMFTRYCNARYDSAGSQIPIISPPSSSENQIQCYTYVRLFYHPLQGNFVSIISILLSLKLLPQ